MSRFGEMGAIIASFSRAKKKVPIRRLSGHLCGIDFPIDLEHCSQINRKLLIPLKNTVDLIYPAEFEAEFTP
jgi:hypothetical protein